MCHLVWTISLINHQLWLSGIEGPWIMPTPSVNPGSLFLFIELKSRFWGVFFFFFFFLVNIIKGFPGGSVVKNPPANAGDAGLIPGLGKSPGGGSGNSLQYTCLGNPMDRGGWWTRVHGVTKSWTAATAAKLLQSCPTLCNPIDGSPPGSSVPGILQARTLEWVTISFSNALKWKVKVKSLSHVQLFATTWTAAYQAPVHGISQARVLEWGAIAFSKESDMT